MVDLENIDPNSEIAPCEERSEATKLGEWKTVPSPKKAHRSAPNKGTPLESKWVDAARVQPPSQSSKPPMSSASSSGTSKLMPPKHRSGLGSKTKYIPIQSSGYGRGARSQSAAQNHDSGDTSDDCSVGSVGSIQTVGSVGVGRLGLIINEHIIASSAQSRRGRRQSRSTPTSPVSSKTGDFSTLGIQRRSSSRIKERYEGSTTWAKKQRQQQEQRQKRNKRILDSKMSRQVHQPSKRAAVSPVKPASNKATKIVESSSPGSVKGTTTPVSQLIQVASNLLSSFRSPPRSETFNAALPMSYSKATAMARAGTPPTIGRMLFDDKTKLMLQELSGFDPNVSQVRDIAEKVFANGTGISDDEIRKTLNSKSLSTGAKQWELKKKVEAANNQVKDLKSVMNMLLRGKNKLIYSAVEAEKKTRMSWERALRTAKIMDEERSALKKSIKQLEIESSTMKDNIKDLQRDLSNSDEKVSSVETQLRSLKDKLAEAEKAHTEASIKLAISEARSEEAANQAQGWRAEIASLETSKAEAIMQTEMNAAVDKDRELRELREECASLKMKMEAREEELCRLVGVDMVGGSNVNLDSVKRELDKIKVRNIELESQLVSRESELEKVKGDSKAAVDRAAAKDKDMSELAKGLLEVQHAGQAREEEANMLRKAAESKAAKMDHLCTEARHEISVLRHDKDLMTKSLENTKTELRTAEDLNVTLKGEIAEQKSDITSQISQVHMERELRARAEVNVEEERRERISCSAQMVAMTQEHARIEAKLKEENVGLGRHWREKLDVQVNALNDKEELRLEAKQIISGLEAELNSLKKSLSDQKNMANARNAEEIGKLTGEINVLKERLKAEHHRTTSVSTASAEQVAGLEAQIREGHVERRRMHNLVQELRGNVRVFARVRPFLPSDGAGDDAKPFVVPKNESSLKLIKGDDQQGYNFTFDRVFPPSVGQETVFEEVSELIQSALDGYNVCLFSYGQTGSGKTHTMQGSGNGAMRGIIPRSIQQVGSYKVELEGNGWLYEMKVSFLEIYNENIRDLLREKKSEEQKHEIKVNSDGHRFVADITMRALDPNDPDAVEEVMRQAAKHRSVASTDMNAVSSRSHSVFTLHLTAVHSERKEVLRGALNLVDLAGSERLDRSGAVGARAKEAVSINKSLSSLTDVFAAIGKKAGHIPFRNSKLTYLLQPCLSGDGKTLMVVNLSPTEKSSPESLCSLRFASHVNKCELGKARKQIEDVSDEKSTQGSTPVKAGGRTQGSTPVKVGGQISKRLHGVLKPTGLKSKKQRLLK